MARESYTPKKENLWLMDMLLRNKEFVTLDYLMKQLKCTKQTIYNYKNELEKKGIVVLSNNASPAAFRIEENMEAYSGIDNNEFHLLMELLSKNDLKHIKDLRIKIMGLISNARFRTQYLKEKIDAIDSCIKHKKMIELDVYYSRDKGATKNVVLNPVLFDRSSGRLYANKLGESKVKTYNLENMGTVRLSAKDKIKVEFKKSISNVNKDPFGFPQGSNEYDVTLLLKPFAHSQLFRQFPLIMKYVNEIKGSNEYSHRLIIKVYDIQPIARFVSGLLTEVKILGTQHAKDEIKEYIQNRVFKGYEENFGN